MCLMCTSMAGFQVSEDSVRMNNIQMTSSITELLSKCIFSIKGCEMHRSSAGVCVCVCVNMVSVCDTCGGVCVRVVFVCSCVEYLWYGFVCVCDV